MSNKVAQEKVVVKQQVVKFNLKRISDSECFKIAPNEKKKNLIKMKFH